MPSVTLLPCCPLCDQPISVYEEHMIYIEDDYKTLAHLECVVDLGEKDEFEEEDDGVEYVQFPDEEEEEEEWD
jgi:hypothetical protein